MGLHTKPSRVHAKPHKKGRKKLWALSGTVGFLALAGTAGAYVSNITQNLQGGQTDTIRCATPGETWNTKGFPLVDHCPLKGVTTTTTSLPASTTTIPTTTTASSTTVAPATTTTLAISPTTTTTVPATTTTTRCRDPFRGCGTTTTTVGTTTTTGPTTTSTTTPSGTVSYASPPPASLISNSIFNKPVVGDSVLANSSAIVSNLIAQYQDNYSGNFNVNFNRPVYYAAPGTPNVGISVASGCNDFTPDTGTQVPIPSFAVAGGSSDNILTVYSPSQNKVWEFWEAQKTANAWSACWGGEATLSTFNGVFPNPYGETATGISNLATEVSEADIASGSIQHALAIEVLGDECDWDIAPADRSDCSQTNANYPAEGMYFRIAPGTATPSGLTPFAQEVFTALKTYGMVVVDQGGDPSIEADAAGYYTNEQGPWELEGGNASTDPMDNTTDSDAAYDLLAGIPFQDLQAIAPPS